MNLFPWLPRNQIKTLRIDQLRMKDRMEKITLTIDGQQVEAGEGMTVLEVAPAADLYIPTRCGYPDLVPMGGGCVGVSRHGE